MKVRPEVTLHGELVIDDHGFDAMESSWKALQNDTVYDVIYLNYFWLRLAWKHYRIFDPTCRLLILCIYERPGGLLIGILPLMTRRIRYKRVFRIRQIAYLCDYFCDESGFVIRKGYTVDVLDFFCNWLTTTYKDWHTLLLRNMSARNPITAILSECLSRAGIRNQCVPRSKNFYLTPKSSFDAYVHMLSASFRQNLRTAGNRLQEMEASGGLTAFFSESSHITAGEIQSLIGLDLARQGAKGRLTMFRHSTYCAFIEALLTQHPECVSIMAYKWGDATMAFSFNLRHGNRYIYWSPSINPDFLAYSPGQLLLEAIVKKCFEEGLELDFATGESEYKSRWTEQFYPILQVRAFNHDKIGIRLASRL